MMPHFIIRRLTSAQARVQAGTLVRIYRESWLATYPDSDIGISISDIAEHFADRERIMRQWKNKEVSGSDKAVWVMRMVRPAVSLRF